MRLMPEVPTFWQSFNQQVTTHSLRSTWYSGVSLRGTDKHRLPTSQLPTSCSEYSTATTQGVSKILTCWMFLANPDVCGMFLANFDVCGMFLANGKRMELRIFYLLGKENKVDDRWRPLAAIMVNVHCGSGDISVGIITSVVLFLTLFFGWCFVLYVWVLALMWALAAGPWPLKRRQQRMTAILSKHLPITPS